MNQMKDIKTIPQLIEFLKKQKDNSIPNYKREYCDRPANENDLTDPNVSPYDENIFKTHIIENYILSDKIDEILKSYPNYEFTEDEVLTIAKNINSGAIQLCSDFFIAPDSIECEIKNKKFKRKFNEIRELANES